MRITIACPEPLIADANQLARALGRSGDDDRVFGAADWRDAAGNAYAVASGLFPDGFPDIATAPLAEPEWGADLAAAARAQAVLAFDQPAAPARLAAAVGSDIDAALALLGVARADALLED